MNLQKRIESELLGLKDIVAEYEALSPKKGNKYDYRIQALHEGIDLLEIMLSGGSTIDEWNVCLEEDKKA